MAKMPTFDSLMNPTLRALRELGGSGSIDEINEKVVELENIPQHIAGILHNEKSSSLTEVGYRLAWARTYLKKYGLVTNSARGVWALTPKARETEHVKPSDVVRLVRADDARKKPSTNTTKTVEPEPPETLPDEEWKSILQDVLLNRIDDKAFERLAQRMLRESGFQSVEVTGRSSDGGIDGNGIVRIQGFMSFHVIFQCKKYRGAVGAAAIRDFRGAMVGRTDKGLFITTGTFTSEAVKEATRDGAPPIDLVDGDDLADKLKELGLGVECEMVENVTVNEEWFQNL